jgi:hypothetical protein
MGNLTTRVGRLEERAGGMNPMVELTWEQLNGLAVVLRAHRDDRSIHNCDPKAVAAVCTIPQELFERLVTWVNRPYAHG